MPIIDDGSAIPGGAGVDANDNLRVNLPGYSATGVIQNGGPEAGAAMFVENDPGEKTGARFVRSPEVDSDYRLRVAEDFILDRETFNYSAQNTGKHTITLTGALVPTVSAAGLLSNSANSVASGTGYTFGTFAEFPAGIGSTALYCETSMSMSHAAAPTNMVFDVGIFRRVTGATPYAPADGAYFRVTSAGWVGVINRGGSETTTGVFAFTPVANQNYLFTISASEKKVRFWIDDTLYGTLENTGAGQPYVSCSLPWSVRHANTGVPSSAYQVTISDYTISLGGPVVPSTLAQVGNRTLGSYQGLSGGTMGQLSTYANSANPTAAVPANGSLTANLLAGLGGQVWETATIALNTDGILMAYQVPAGTTAVQGRRLVINGISLFSHIQTVIAGGPFVCQYILAFGSTSANLGQGESASFATGTTKAPRRIALPAFTQVVTAAQAVSTLVSQPGGANIQFINPIYVNPGEFVMLGTKHIGTVGTSGTIAHTISLDYGWE